MKLWTHFIATSLLALVLFPSFGIGAFWAFTTGFLIDIDHYFFYLIRFRFRKLNPFKANKFFIENKFHGILCIFHTYEFFGIMLVIAFFSVVGRIMLLALLVHHAMDFYSELRLGSIDAKAKSVIMYLIKRIK